MIIGISGKKYSGKDTSADYICMEFGFEKMAFADPLKQICKTLYCLDQDQFDDKEKIDERWGISVRSMLQKIGTDVFRNHLEKDIWIKNMHQRILKNPNKNIVISDVRFENEKKWIEEQGGIIIYMHRPNRQHNDPHESESISFMNPESDIIIVNDENIETLYKKINHFVKNLLNHNK